VVVAPARIRYDTGDEGSLLGFVTEKIDRTHGGARVQLCHFPVIWWDGVQYPEVVLKQVNTFWKRITDVTRALDPEEKKEAFAALQEMSNYNQEEAVKNGLDIEDAALDQRAKKKRKMEHKRQKSNASTSEHKMKTLSDHNSVLQNQTKEANQHVTKLEKVVKQLRDKIEGQKDTINNLKEDLKRERAVSKDAIAKRKDTEARHATEMQDFKASVCDAKKADPLPAPVAPSPHMMDMWQAMMMQNDTSKTPSPGMFGGPNQYWNPETCHPMGSTMSTIGSPEPMRMMMAMNQMMHMMSSRGAHGAGGHM